MTTPRRAGRPMPVDLMFGGDEAEALLESWLGDDADATAGPPVRVVDAPEPPAADPDPDPGRAPAAWRPPPSRAPFRRPR